MPMQGKILQQGKCDYCKGRYVLLQPKGADNQKLMHSNPPCKKFEEDPQAYLQWHSMTRRQRRVAKSKKKGPSQAVMSRGRRRKKQ